jgi:hypothetical protein
MFSSRPPLFDLGRRIELHCNDRRSSLLFIKGSLLKGSVVKLEW